MAATKIKPAFPGRASAMGYEPGLKKLEYIVTQLMAGGEYQNTSAALEMAQKIIVACEKAGAND
jgi:hypothetical protein